MKNTYFAKEYYQTKKNSKQTNTMLNVQMYYLNKIQCIKNEMTTTKQTM